MDAYWAERRCWEGWKGGTRRLTILLVVLSAAALLASGCEPGELPQTCEELAPLIIDISKEQDNQLTGHILKLYDIEAA